MKDWIVSYSSQQESRRTFFAHGPRLVFFAYNAPFSCLSYLRRTRFENSCRFEIVACFYRRFINRTSTKTLANPLKVVGNSRFLT